MPILHIRKWANREGQHRIKMYDPLTGEPKLVNPATAGMDHEPWPLAGITIEGEAPPTECTVNSTFVANGRREGWLAVEGEQAEHVPAGPPDDLYRVPPHTFVKYSRIVLYTLDGDVTYRVVHNPGKYEDPNEPAGYRVDWFYGLELEEDPTDG